MDETPLNDKPTKDFNKIDLAQLQSFSFGTQWTQDKASSGHKSDGGREPRRDDRPGRDGSGGGPAGAPRDRRGFRKPAGPGGEGNASASVVSPGVPREVQGGGEFRGPRRDDQGRGEFRGGGPRRDGAAVGGQRFGGPREGNGFPVRDPGPYISPFFTVVFYPEDTGFAALAKAIRMSCRTYELFEIARVIIGKHDRYVAVIQHKIPEEVSADTPKSAPFAVAVPDGVPFENEAAAIAYVLDKHLGQFFDVAEVEVEAPKGNFQVVNKCMVTGELLGPPNYHRYTQIVQQHHAAHIKISFEAYRGRIESVREPEAIAQWLEKMKKATRYTWKLSPAPAPVVLTEGETAPEPVPAPAFDTVEEAKNFLLAQARDKVVRTTEAVRFHGKNIETLPQGELRRSLEGALERQRRFPLDTANALRGRLRREGFTIFKKGSKGISYVCAVKRKFRVPGQVFADSIGALIAFIESHPMIKASELADKFLGFSAPVAVKPVEAAAVPSEGATTEETSAPVPAAVPVASLTVDQMAKLNRLNGDLRWLVSEGYVTEFIDGRIFAPPAVVEARKKEIEGAEHDPENFPEAPVSESPATAPKAPAVEATTGSPSPESENSSS